METLRYFSVDNGRAKEIIFPLSGHFEGRIVGILSPEEAEKKNRLDSICGNETFQQFMPQIEIAGTVIYLGVSMKPKGEMAKLVVNYNFNDEFPNLKLGDKVRAIQLLNEKGQMEIYMSKPGTK